MQLTVGLHRCKGYLEVTFLGRRPSQFSNCPLTSPRKTEKKNKEKKQGSTGRASHKLGREAAGEPTRTTKPTEPTRPAEPAEPRDQRPGQKNPQHVFRQHLATFVCLHCVLRRSALPRASSPTSVAQTTSLLTAGLFESQQALPRASSPASRPSHKRALPRACFPQARPVIELVESQSNTTTMKHRTSGRKETTVTAGNKRITLVPVFLPRPSSWRFASGRICRNVLNLVSLLPSFITKF